MSRRRKVAVDGTLSEAEGPSAIRYDKHDENYLRLIRLACGLLWYRRLYRLAAAWRLEIVSYTLALDGQLGYADGPRPFGDTDPRNSLIERGVVPKR